MKRLFLAIPLPDEEIKRLDAYLVPYRSDPRFANAKWVEPQNFHLTLLFLGEVQEMMIPEMLQILRGFFAQIPAFELQFESLELFPGKSPTMIWARFHKSFPLTELKSELRKYLSPYVQEIEDEKESISHLTLARLKTPIDSRKFAFKPYQMPLLQINECHLYESELSEKGPTYTLIENLPFAY